MQPLYQAIYKNKPYGEPVTWDEMLNLRCTIKNLKWRIVTNERAG